MTPESYGPFKALCEQAVQKAFGSRALIARPGLIVGAHDYTNRSAYWVQRLADGDEILAPGKPDRRIQLIDAHDLALWLVRMAEGEHGGLFNVTGPALCREGSSLSQNLLTCRLARGSASALGMVLR